MSHSISVLPCPDDPPPDRLHRHAVLRRLHPDSHPGRASFQERGALPPSRGGQEGGGMGAHRNAGHRIR